MSINNSFLGTGWAFPPRFINNGAEVVMVSDEEDIEESIRILISTSLGERLMHPDFGCDLTNFLFEEIDQGLLTQLKEIITDAILYYEPRIEPEDVDIFELNDTEGLLGINIEYKIRKTNARNNLVYPFYIKEGINAGE